MRSYETMLVFDARLSDADIEAAVGRFAELVTERAGEMGEKERWGRRRFAQEIDGLTEGFYYVLNYTLDPGKLGEIAQALPFFEGLLRHKTVVPVIRTRRTS